MSDRAAAKNTDGGYGVGRRKAYVEALKIEHKTLTERATEDKPNTDRLAQITAELDRFGDKPATRRGQRETATA